MRIHILVLPFFLYTFSCGASANNIPCESLADLNNPNPKLCICKESLSKLPITVPQGLLLTGACNFDRPYGGDVFGSYAFQGNVFLSGVITWKAHFFEGEEGDPSLQFVADDKVPYSQFRSESSVFGFRDTVKAAKQFRAPKLTRKSRCWKAPVAIYLRTLVVDVGYGTDSEGTFAEQFQIQRIEKYSPCKSR